jgi:hypothetical protein
MVIRVPRSWSAPDGGPCQFMVLQGIGVYDNVRVGSEGRGRR